MGGDQQKTAYPLYGLLGRKLPYSFSPEIHGMLGNEAYGLVELEPEELDGFMRSRPFRGINVTIPYKKAVIPYLDEISDRARRIGAVNTIVKREDGSLFGDNTDYLGMRYMLRHAGIRLEGARVLILGSGGTSLTARTLCEDEGAAGISIVSRSGELNYENVSRLRADTEVIINTTPVGTYPGNGESPIDPGLFPSLRAVADVIYNPHRTKLLMDAEELGLRTISGLRMLIAQAVAAHELFFDTKAPEGVTEEIYRRLKNRLMNICLIGMPGCGKTTVARELARLCKKEFFDSDACIEKEADMSIPDIFATYGETYFRELETEACRKLGAHTGAIIATGGGVVLKEDNMRSLRQNGLIVFLERDLAELSMEGRPLSKSMDDLKRIYEDRIELYRGYADMSFLNEEPPARVAERIREMAYEAADY